MVINTIGCVKIYDEAMPDYWGATSRVGYYGGHTILKLDTALVGGSELLQRTALHELGHVLGLYHEHQRHDRDDWIIVNGGGSDYEKIPKNISGLKIEWLQIKVGWWTISIPVPTLRETTYSTTYGPFDFSSVMLYDGFIVKKTQGTTKAGSTTFGGRGLSVYDIAAIKQMY